MTITLVLADDHGIFRDGLANLLTQDGELQLLGQASDGLEAWNLIAELQPDIAVLDIAMPKLTGLEVTRRVVAADLPTRIIVLTMHEDPATCAQAQQIGSAGYVLKDNSYEELATAIRTVATGESYISRSVQQKLMELQKQGYVAKSLSAREREVIGLIARGNSSKEIARVMDISPRTVDTYRKRLMEKLGLRTIADVVRYAVRTGMVP